jgi:flagellar protein FlbT
MTTVLVLEIKANDLIIINGASMRVGSNTRIELGVKARFLFGKQIMRPEEAVTPGRRIYYAIQTAYVGDEEERRPAYLRAREYSDAFAAHTTSRLACEILDDAMRALDEDRCYAALKLVRRIIRHEDAVAAHSTKPSEHKSMAESAAA